MSAEILTRYAGWPVIAGAGLAGLCAALHMDRPCVVLSPSSLGENAASALAQGGVAAAVGADDDAERHALDTLHAGAGLCEPDVVRVVTAAGPAAIEQMERWGVAFARTASGSLDLHLEAAHSHARIVHASGDGTGAAIMGALIRRVRETPRIVVLEGVCLSALHIVEGAVRGVWIDGECFIPTQTCILASGGAGALYAETTSPVGNRGLGLAVAARAGARLADMEFVQFHPTALDVGAQIGRRPLVSEAVRGAGALLVDETGERFTDELAPRDVVSRAVAAHLRGGHRVFLDARAATGGAFAARFPGIAASCRGIGIDPDREPIPVRPAVHYHMGGVQTDLHGRTSVPGLWACGEVACTGLHGANRLASNSLLEAFVMGRAVGWDVNGSLKARLSCQNPEAPRRFQARSLGRLMSEGAGILRDAASLEKLLARLAPLAAHDDAALVGSAIVWAALRRQESRGSHWRTDFPQAVAPTRRDFTLSGMALDQRSLEYA